MEYAIGYLAGLITATFVALVLSFFKKPLIVMGSQMMKNIEAVGPRGRGFLFEPESDEEVARQDHIAANKEAGKDTPISELQNT